MLRALPFSFLLAVMATPALAGAPQLGFFQLLMFSHPLQKLIMFLIVAATVAAIAISIRKLAQGNKLVGGSAFVSGLRLGGPLLGLLGASYATMNIFVALSGFNEMVNPVILMPAIAEAFAVLIVGLISGVIAVIANWAIEARIDKEVLRIQ